MNYQIIESIESLIKEIRELKNVHVCEEITLSKEMLNADGNSSYEDYIKIINLKIYSYNDKFVFDNYKLLYTATIKQTYPINYLTNILEDLNAIHHQIVKD